MNWLPIVIFFATPLALGVLFMFAAFRLRRTWARYSAGVIGLMCVLAFAASVIAFGPYMWASYLESRWRPVNPKSRAELESFLSLYSRRDIQPSQSDWGRGHQLEPGERMTQYLLLWNAPMEVVYSSNDGIVAIYTSYE